MLALAAVLALALGTVLRRSAAAVTAAIVVIVLPYLFTVAAPVLPLAAQDWLLRVTPAAAFAVQATLPQYHAGHQHLRGAAGYFPLAPWAGLAVLAAWTAAALALAAWTAAAGGTRDGVLPRRPARRVDQGSARCPARSGCWPRSSCSPRRSAR